MNQTKTLTFVSPLELDEKLQAQADKEMTNKSSVIRRAIAAYLRQEGVEV